MKAMFVAVLLTAAFSSAPAQHLERDKVEHFVTSAAFGALTVAARPDWSTGSQVAVAMLPGLAKELYDSRRSGSGFSAADLVADGLGAYAGVVGWRWLVLPKSGGGVQVQWNSKF